MLPLEMMVLKIQQSLIKSPCPWYISVPGEPNNLTATVISSSSVTISWRPNKHESGETNYTVVVDGELEQHSGTFEYVKTVIVQGKFRKTCLWRECFICI